MNTIIVTIATTLMAVAALLGAASGFVRFFYKRGGDERTLAQAVTDNTAAQRELSISLREFKDFTVAQLHDLALSHEKLAGEVAVIKEQVKKGA